MGPRMLMTVGMGMGMMGMEQWEWDRAGLMSMKLEWDPVGLIVEGSGIGMG